MLRWTRLFYFVFLIKPRINVILSKCNLFVFWEFSTRKCLYIHDNEKKDHQHLQNEFTWEIVCNFEPDRTITIFNSIRFKLLILLQFVVNIRIVLIKFYRHRNLFLKKNSPVNQRLMVVVLSFEIKCQHKSDQSITRLKRHCEHRDFNLFNYTCRNIATKLHSHPKQTKNISKRLFYSMRCKSD